jgi:putative Mg2+ transporter-C (MgtC) family protein
MDIPENWLDLVMRLVAATVLTAVIGLEREIRDMTAGLRTHMLVGLGSTAFTLFAYGMIDDMSNGPPNVQLDPLRIVEAVVGGLGFLGAGAIIRSQGNVYGMTTAASIWLAGAIGVGCGMGQMFIVVVTTAITMLCLVPLRIMEKKLKIRNPDHD